VGELKGVIKRWKAEDFPVKDRKIKIEKKTANQR